MRLAEKKPEDVIAIRKKTVDELMSAVDLFDVTNGILRSWRAFHCSIENFGCDSSRNGVGDS
jgi:hypothetical protein